MSNILFGYDLNKKPNPSEYTELVEKIKKTFPNYWHCLDSTWIVDTDMTPTQVRDWLSPILKSDDESFVVDITGKSAAWRGFTGEHAAWLYKQ